MEDNQKYKLFTFPNCSHCSDVKKYLKEKKIKYEEINAGIGEGRKEFREFYLSNKDKIKREEDGTISLPILVDNKELVQGIEKILKKDF